MKSFLRPDAEVVASYIDLRIRLIDLLGSLPDEIGERVVPHCPAWTVGDLAAHIVGTPEDIVAGRMEGVTTDAWTQAQVDRHRGESPAVLARSFSDTAAAFDPVLPHIPSPVNSQLVMDAVTHEHDLRHAVGRIDARESSAVVVGLGWLLDMADRRQPGLANELLASGASRFDLLRVLTGRRSPAQIAALGLDTDRVLELLTGTPLRPPAEAIHE